MKKLLNRLPWIMFITPWLLLGCNSVSEANLEDKIYLSDIEIIQSMGFHTEGLIEMDNCYIVEGDIEISKELLKTFMLTRQASAPNLVAKSRLNNLTYDNSSLTSLPTPIITGSHTSALPSTVVTLLATCNTTLPVSYEWTVSNGQIIYSHGNNIKVSAFSWPSIRSTVKCRVKSGDFVSEWGTYTISILRYAPPGDGPCVICGSTGACDCETIIVFD